MNKKIFPLTAILLSTIMFACSGPLEREVLVFFNGDAEISQNKITNKTSMLFNSKEMDMTGFKNMDKIEVEKDGQKISIPFPKEKGFYILNLSADTIYGGRKSLKPIVIDSANVAQAKGLVDSLQTVLDGKSTSSVQIFPDELLKVSDNPKNVRAFAPYKELYGAIEGTDDGSEPEIFKFNAREEVIFEQKNYQNIYEPIELKNSKSKK